MWRGTIVAGAVVAAASLAFGQAERQSGLQITPDEQQVLINKDVNDERWAIVLNPNGTVTGNVFPTDGGPPAFVWCEPIEDQSTEEELVFSCFGADACQASPCSPDEWTFVADVTLPVTFFLPPQAVLPTATPGGPTPTPVPIGTPTPDGSATPSPTDTPDDTETPDPTDTPDDTETPDPTPTPIPIATPD